MKNFEVRKETYRTTNFGFVIPVGEDKSEGVFNTLEEAKDYVEKNIESKQINLSNLAERYTKLHIYEINDGKENLVETIDKNYE